MNRSARLVALVCAGGCFSSASGQVVYSHYVTPPTWNVLVWDREVAEYVTLSGGAQRLASAEVRFGALSSSPNGEGTLHLAFYNDAGGVPGALIGAFSRPVNLVGTGPVDLGLSTGGLNVPGSVWVGVQFARTAGGIAGVIVNGDAPTVGSVSATRAFRQGGTGPWGTLTVTNWMTMRLTAEPAQPCYANCDASTIAPVLNVNDFICFQTRFAAGDSYANCDASTIAPALNVNDFICFQTAFAAGCS